jgi:trk system potassium uptake protein TrkH
MFVGGASGSAAGGLKVGAFAVLLAMIVATLRGREEVTVFRRQIPTSVVQQATTLALYFVALVFGFTLLLTVTTDQPFIDVIFEAVSAIATVGYSSGDTLTFGSISHSVLIAAMIVGRFSPMLLVLYMSRPQKKTAYRFPQDSIRLG